MIGIVSAGRVVEVVWFPAAGCGGAHEMGRETDDLVDRREGGCSSVSGCSGPHVKKLKFDSVGVCACTSVGSFHKGNCSAPMLL